MKSSNKNILLLLMMYTLVLSVKGQDVYSLDECITAALQHNVRIKNADNDIKMAEHDKKETFTKSYKENRRIMKCVSLLRNTSGKLLCSSRN